RPPTGFAHLGRQPSRRRRPTAQFLRFGDSMPELPDVEVFRRQIERHALHRRITAVRAPDRRMLEGTSESALRRALVGRSLVATRRHGKYLFAATSDHGGWLMLHFGMTGAIHIVP